MMIEIKELKKISIHPDECLLIKLNKDLTINEMDQIVKTISKSLPKEIKCLIYSEDIGEFQVIKQL